MDLPDNTRPANAYQALTQHALAGFRLLGLANGIALLLVLSFSMGIVGADIDPPDLQEAALAFTGGLACGALGLLFSYLAHFSLFRQIAAGRAGRGHWLPMVIGVLAYLCAVVAFVLGCWSTVANSSSMLHDDASYQNSNAALKVSAPAPV
ncbi:MULTISPECIES: hypothetical protein [unclassified Achromobacter]|uniref:hypothetical protein n=1 Tax=unclassified Achromobacter TaxID=2626865 RepID=UPI000B516C88|nr:MULTISPECIES: hypothetical protein [unclassified Achromobacter]OWT77218.1 hypothetical protein CEY04_14720 [Achromobacter sp. HZ28]OWT78099.1 hypothetical protein CEY05_09215 [Achromobacter sp. HZ34]